MISMLINFTRRAICAKAATSSPATQASATRGSEVEKLAARKRSAKRGEQETRTPERERMVSSDGNKETKP